MKLYTYCIPVDDGAAPNPYFGVCTLAICKPAIRRTAEIGDWIVGVGSKNVNDIDFSGKIVYAMKVTDKMTYAEYNVYCQRELKEKIPDLKHADYNRKVGDCVYDDADKNNIFQRASVHGPNNIDTDKGGKHVLLSDYFFYFGDKAISIPPHLTPIIHQTQSHKVHLNELYKNEFVQWIENIDYPQNTLIGNPQITLPFDDAGKINKCATKRNDWGIEDEKGIC